MPRTKEHALPSAVPEQQVPEQQTPATPDNAISDETIPRGVDDETMKWAQSTARSLESYSSLAEEKNPDQNQLRDALGDVVKALAKRLDLLLQFRGWPLATAGEKAAGAWLRATGHCHDVERISPVDFLSISTSLREVWEKFCRPPEMERTLVVPIETLAELDRLSGVTGTQICAIFAEADRTDDEAKYGPWLYDAAGGVPSPNVERLAAARRGEAKTPSTRTTKVQPSGWPREAPILWLLRQAAELVDAD